MIFKPNGFLSLNHGESPCYSPWFKIRYTFVISLFAFIWSLQRWARATFFLGPQSQFHKEALPQSQFRKFLKKYCSATATPQFRNRNFFRSPQLESFTSAIFGIFLALE
jgi:hypothetical protein